MRKQSIDEKGQVLVFIILAIVAIFGFAALAVDFGRVFSERRRAQNAADAAAYAAAYAGAKSQDWKAAGIASSLKNGYNDTDAAQNSGAVTDVRIFHPPVRGKYSVASESINPNEYYQVIIRTRVDKIFSQFVYKDDLWVEVEAVTHATVQMGFPSGAAIVATCTDCCAAIKIGGTGDVFIEGGSVISNSTKKADNCPSAWRNGTAVINVTGGSILTAGDKFRDDTNKDCKDKDGNIVSPCTQADSIGKLEDPQTYYYPYVPSCSFDTAHTYTTSKFNSTATLSPGVYKNGIQVAGKGTVITLSPGMYCLDGNFSVPSGSVIGSNVMIYMRKGSVSINTSQPVSLAAPTEDANCIHDDAIQAGFCWSGFLFYMPPANLGTISLAGGGTTSYTGTIYATGEVQGGGAKCSILGSQEETKMKTSIICYTVEVGGTNSLNIVYDPNLNAQSPGSLELTE